MDTNDNPSMTAAVRDVARTAVSSIPGQFVAIFIIDALLVVAVMWFLFHWFDARVAATDKLIDVCLQKVLH